LAERAEVIISDPKALASAERDLKDVSSGKVRFVEDPYEAVRGAHAIALMTDWSVYRTLDYARIYERMQKPAFIFDGRNILPHRELHELGFNVFPTGKAALLRT
jgi:UDPglucose 6-dehydrogenase